MEKTYLDNQSRKHRTYGLQCQIKRKIQINIMKHWVLYKIDIDEKNILPPSDTSRNKEINMIKT